MLENCETLNNQAIELASHGEYKEAIACFMRAIALERENYLLWFNLGITYRDSGDLPAARVAMEKACAVHPEDDEVLEALASLCFAMDDLDAAMGYCLAGLDVNSMNSHLWNTMGVVFFNQTNYIEASEAFEYALTINPYYYDALFNLRDTYNELGNTVGEAECEARLTLLKGR